MIKNKRKLLTSVILTVLLVTNSVCYVFAAEQRTISNSGLTAVCVLALNDNYCNASIDTNWITYSELEGKTHYIDFYGNSGQRTISNSRDEDYGCAVTIRSNLTVYYDGYCYYYAIDNDNIAVSTFIEHE